MRLWCACGVALFVGVMVKAEETVLKEVQWSEEAQSNSASFVQHPVILQHLLLLEKTHVTQKTLCLSQS